MFIYICLSIYMKKTKFFVPTLFLMCFNLYLTACSKEDYHLEGPIEIEVIERRDTIVYHEGDSIRYDENGDTLRYETKLDTIKYANKKQIVTDFDELSYDNILIENAFVMEKNVNNSFQGLAIHEDYLLQTYHTKNYVDVYDLTNNKFVFSLIQKAEGTVHCNNADFGDFYEPTDPFPLLYLEHRGGTMKTSVYRIVNKTGNLELEKVQTLSFSSCTSCFTNNNGESSEMFITFRNEKHPEDSLSIAKIDIPDYHTASLVIDLESSVVKEKYDIARNKTSQDATIYKNKLFQLKGGPGSGELWIYDLIKHKTIHTIDWNEVGMTGEPEGIGWYKDHLVITNNSGQVYNLYFVR